MSEISFVGNMPRYMTTGAAGADLESNYSYGVIPGNQVMVDTGTAVSIPEGFFGMVVPRSSLCNKGGLRLVNSVGIIDSDYRGNIMFCYKNTGKEPVLIEKGERIGQLVIVPFVKAEFKQVDALEDTERGSGGFGSTGGK